MDVLEAIHCRRSVREFTEQPVPDEEWFTERLRREMNDDGSLAQSFIESCLWEQRRHDCLEIAKSQSGGMILHELTTLLNDTEAEAGSREAIAAEL